MSYKCVVFADTHWGKSKDSDDKLRVTDEFFDRFSEWILKNGVREVFFLGDLFENRNSIDVNTLNMAYDGLKKLVVGTGVKLHLLAGNHDCYYNTENTRINSLRPMSDVANVEVYYERTALTVNGRGLLLCPWGADMTADSRYDYAFGHFHPNEAVKGVSYGIGDVMRLAPVAFSGHIHQRQERDGFIFVGSPYELDFGDVNVDKGWYCLDLDSGEYEFVRNQFSPTHVKLYLSEIRSDPSRMSPAALSRNYAQLVVDVKFEYDELTSIKSKIGECSPASLDVEYLYNTSELVLDESSIVRSSTNREYVAAYVSELFREGDADVMLDLVNWYYDKAEESLASKNISAQTVRVDFKKVSAQNFKSIGDRIEFDFSNKNGLVYIYGTNKDVPGLKNGVGKSCAFVDLLCFGLYGRTLKSTTKDNIPNRIMAESKIPTEVCVEFDIGPDRYKTVTTMKKRGSAVSFRIFKNDVDETLSTSAKSREWLQQILQCDFELFKNSIIISSSDKYVFFEQDKQQRRSYIESLLNLSIFGEMLRMMRDDANAANNESLILQRDIRNNREFFENSTTKMAQFEENRSKELELIRSKISLKTSQMNDAAVEDDGMSDRELSLIGMKDQISRHRDECVRRKDDSKGEFDRLSVAAAKAAHIADALARKREELFKLNSEGDVVPLNEKEIAAVESSGRLVARKDENEAEIRRLTTSASDLLKDMKHAKIMYDKHKNVLDIVCDDCEALVKSHFDISDYESVEAGNLEEIKKCEAAAADLRAKNFNIDGALENIRRLSERMNRCEIAAKSKAKLRESLEKDIAALDSELMGLEPSSESVVKDMLADASGRVKELSEKISKLDANLDNIQKLEIKRIELDSRRAARAMAAGAAKKELESLGELLAKRNTEANPFSSDVEAYSKKLTEKESLCRSMEERRLRLVSAQRIVSEDGVKKYIIKDVIDNINGLIKRYLMQIDAEFVVVFDDTFEYTFLTKTGECEYNSLSKGERQRLCVAMLLAFKDIISINGVDSNVFIIDEILDDGLDESGILAVCDAMRTRCSDRRQTAYIISHRAELAGSEYFSAVVEVVKHNGMTTLNERLV